MSSHTRSGGPHDAALTRVPHDADSLAEMVRKGYIGHGALPQIRDLAALLAEKRPVHRSLSLLERVPTERDMWAELIACLMQELVMRRVNLTRVPAAVRCAAALRKQGHPLAGLPLKRSKGERHAYPCDFPWRYFDGACHVPENPEIEWLPQAQEGERYQRPIPVWDAWLAKVPVCESRIVSTQQDERLISSAVQHWNSYPLAKIIELPRRFDPEEVASLWVNAFLPAPYRTTWALNGRLHSLGSVVNDLFGAAYVDAVFNVGARAGYGRLKAWQSIAGLVRAPADAPVHRINELAARWTFMAFRLTTQTPLWADRELAIGALSPGGNVLSLLISDDKD